MSEKLLNLQANIADSLEDIRRLFKGEPKITLIVRNPGIDDGDVVLSDDDLDMAIGAIRHLQKKATHVFPPTEVTVIIYLTYHDKSFIFTAWMG